MKPKIFIGWTVILLISFAPVFLWFFFGPGTEELGDYASITHSLGELSGLIAMTMFALTFILSTRVSFIEDIFGGLDKVYIAHAILGGSALILILSHPILLVLKFIPSNLKQAATYLLPSSSWSVNFGIIALLGMMFLIYLTLYTKIKYQNWKFSHEFFGLVFIFAVLHTFLVRGNASKDIIFSGYYIYASVVSLIGLGGFSYSLFLKDRLFKAAIYEINSIRKISEDAFEIKLIPERKAIRYKSGQFVYIRFYNERLSDEAHPFSITSRTNNPEIEIIIKELGDFTDKLGRLKVGDKVSIEGPYGRFSHEQFKSDQVWICGGIGVTPFIGMALDLENLNVANKIDLYYSVKKGSDFIGLKKLKEISSRVPNFRVIPWVSSKKGHLSIKNIHEFSGNLRNKEFFLCGPDGFKRGIINSLINLGVPKKNMHTEEFKFR